MTEAHLARPVKLSPKVHIIIKKGSIENSISYTELASKRMRDANTTYIKRIRADGEVRASTRDIWSEGTYDGADLKPFDGRPGSMAAFALPSHGDRT